MPREHFGKSFKFLPRADLLSFEEITRVARVFVGQGASKLRLTGGEPLLRAELPRLVEQLAKLDVDLALTTNGSLLEKSARELAAAGLGRVTVSLDSLDEGVFRAMTDAHYGVDEVLAGIEAAAAAGLGPIKINCVVRRGVNDHTLVELARHFKGRHTVRFIEYMDVGSTNGWRLDEVVSGREIVERVHRELPLREADPAYRGEVASRFRFADGSGEIGVITSVTQPFCGDCTRLRLSAKGTLYTCLYASAGTDLRELLRSGADDAQLEKLVRALWRGREDRYSEQRSAETQDARRIEMSYIGG